MTDIEARARDAEALKDNAFLTEILDQVKEEAVKAWIATGPEDQLKRELAWTLVKAQGRIRDVIQAAIDSQKIQASRAVAPLALIPFHHQGNPNMTDLTATPETGTVDAPASMDSILAEFETGNPAPEEATEAAVKELVEEAEGGHSDEEANEDDATDATDTGEETVEEEPEEGEEQPEPAFKVKVAGEEVEVPLSELVKGYSREQDYTRKTMALAEERKTLTSQFANELKQHVELFEAFDPILSEADKLTPDDWQALADRDPATYVQLNAAYQARLKARDAARAKLAETSMGNPQAEAAQQAEIAQRETEALIKAVPELSDPEKLKGFATEAVSYLQETGFGPSEIAELTDHRALLIIDKARRYDALQKARQTLPSKKVVPKPAAKPLKTDGSHSDPAPKTRFPANAPRERQLDHIVNQLLKQE